MSSNPGREYFKSTDQELVHPQFFSHIYLTQLTSNQCFKNGQSGKQTQSYHRVTLSHGYTVKCSVEISHMLVFLILAHIAYYF